MSRSAWERWCDGERCEEVPESEALTCFDNLRSDLGKCEHCSGACPVAIHLIFASPIFRRMPRQMSWHHWKVGVTVACKFSFLKRRSKSFGALTMYWCMFFVFPGLYCICCCVLYCFFAVRRNQTAGGGRGIEAGGRECFYYAMLQLLKSSLRDQLTQHNRVPA